MNFQNSQTQNLQNNGEHGLEAKKMKLNLISLVFFIVSAIDFLIDKFKIDLKKLLCEGTGVKKIFVFVYVLLKFFTLYKTPLYIVSVIVSILEFANANKGVRNILWRIFQRTD
jgi:hypothetical protein